MLITAKAIKTLTLANTAPKEVRQLAKRYKANQLNTKSQCEALSQSRLRVSVCIDRKTSESHLRSTTKPLRLHKGTPN
jgi:ribosomal protein S12